LTPGARVAAAIDILGEIENGRPADGVAAGYFRGRRYIGAKDRSEIANHVYSALRHRAAIDWWIARLGKGALASAARTRVLAALVLVEHWPAASVEASCNNVRFGFTKLSSAEAKLIDALSGRTLRHPEMQRAVANDVPEWLEPYLEQTFGRELEHEMAALNSAAPIDLRVNALKADREIVRRALLAEGIASEPTPMSPIGLRLSKRSPISGLAAFRDGLFEVQDEGSQIAALLAGVRPGMRVVDFCAGAGGKTLALAAAMGNRGKLVACDVSGHRLERAAQRLRRAGVSNVERRVLSHERDKWIKRHANAFDRVFVDAPCLGTGTWRRNPDGKWRSQPDDLAELVARQQRILHSAARLVRPGGRLVYVTCSVLREEDEFQAEAFLGTRPDFASIPAARAWGETIGSASPVANRYLLLTPARHGTDGFFVAVFERRARMGVS
jgi:16S rRNA (cytosine967-C5)-methyltransferase